MVDATAKNKGINMNIGENYGLTLTGLLVASQIKSGNRKDDGKAYCLRENTITTGPTTFKYVESLDPTINTHEERELFKDVSVKCEFSSTENGVTTVRGEIQNNVQKGKTDKPD